MSSADEPRPPTARPLRVLVADDDPDILEVVSAAIEGLGADVTRAATGGDVIERLGHLTFDLIITDVAMPWMTGLQAMHSARAAGLGTPVIIITALQEDRIDDQTKSLGDTSVLLRKPFGIDQLHDAMRAVLGGKFPAVERRR
jgi:CheY-like chemotaxis protein